MSAPTSDGGCGGQDLEDGEKFYLDRAWAQALAKLQPIYESDPVEASRLGLQLAIGHCLIELNGDIDLADLGARFGTPTLSELESRRVPVIWVRVAELRRVGDFHRAVRLLRFGARFSPILTETYAECILAGPTACSRLPDRARPPEPPGFLSVSDFRSETIEALKNRWRGRRILFVVRRLYDRPERRCEVCDLVSGSARRFGFVTAEYNSHIGQGGGAAFWQGLEDAINTFRPDVIFYDDLYQSGLSAASDEAANRVAAVLSKARRDLGTFVIKDFPDGWLVRLEDIYRGLGDSVDLVTHWHAEILPRATARESAATFCYPYPLDPSPVVAPAVIPRAGFIGSVSVHNVPRLVWWTELPFHDVPIDFVETDHMATRQLSDEAFLGMFQRYQLSINFTKRGNGSRMMVARSIQIPLAGGVLVEEDCYDTRYFMTPGVHFVPFKTMADLTEIVPALLRDAAYRAELAAGARTWATTYFSGDCYWAGVLQRLERTPR